KSQFDETAGCLGGSSDTVGEEGLRSPLRAVRAMAAVFAVAVLIAAPAGLAPQVAQAYTNGETGFNLLSTRVTTHSCCSSSVVSTDWSNCPATCPRQFNTGPTTQGGYGFLSGTALSPSFKNALFGGAGTWNSAGSNLEVWQRTYPDDPTL